jgi:predicted ATPase
MGLHTGEAVSSIGDYIGLDVHRASRICSVGYGGQILISRAVKDLIAPDPPAGVSLRDLGAHRLKDLKDPEHLFQVVHTDLAADFPSLRSLDARSNNLPIQLTSFIGREREIAEVKTLIGAARLVTLTGSGGAGKTRLALQVAAELAEDYPDGVWLAEFAPVGDPALVPQTVASALSVAEQPGREMAATLVDALRPRSVLLVLDNCEHLLAACADLAATLLRACPHLRLLATSREALGIQGETLWGVPPLSLPDARRLPPAKDLVRYEAARLFVDRAVATAPGFTVTGENAPAVAEVCQRLDGLPLALELAAARVKALTAEQIADRLDDRFRLLTGGSRTVLPRQQTLRAAMDWSYDLLSEQERAVLQRLSVFAGGWTLEAAEDVCAGDLVEKEQVIDLLTQLVDKSLVTAETHGRNAWYRMLETVRQYGRIRLEEAGETARIRSRHLDWYLALAEQARPNFLRRGGPGWLQRLDAERDNLRAALAWSVEANPEAGLRLWNAIRFYWLSRLKEGRAWLARLLERSGAVAALVRVKSLLDLGFAAWNQGDLRQATVLAEEALGLSRELGDKWCTGQSLYCLALIEKTAGHYDRAARLFKESATPYQEAGDAESAASTLRQRGHIAELVGDYLLATTLLEQALAFFREVGSIRGMANSLHALGETKRRQGDVKQALSLLEQSVTLCRELALADPFVFAAIGFGNALRASGDYVRASNVYKDSLTQASENGMKRAVLECVRGVGYVSAFQNRPVQAARLLAAVEALMEGMDFVLCPEEADHDRALASLRAALGDVAFRAAWAEGRAMTLEQVVEHARDAGAEPTGTG